MKVFNTITTFIILVAILLAGCGNIFEPLDELEQVTNYLDFNEIEGTYLFQPDEFQAKKLGVQKGDSVILKMFGGVVQKPHSSTFMRGNYSINKMILVLNSNSDEPYQNEWIFSNWKNSVLENEFINVISFHQQMMNGNNISFDLKKRPSSDTLHIVGNTSDPEFEVIQIIDFKKIK